MLRRAATLGIRPRLRAARPLTCTALARPRLAAAVPRIVPPRTRHVSDVADIAATPPDVTSDVVADAVNISARDESERVHASFYVSNVLPIQLGSWDIRPWLARLTEERLLEELADIAAELKDAYGFRVESWEVARKDGGVFCHFSYFPPHPPELPLVDTDSDFHAPEDIQPEPTSPAALFLPRFVAAAEKHGGWPSWLGSWWSNWRDEKKNRNARTVDDSGHHFYRGDAQVLHTDSQHEVTALRGWQRTAGAGRIWVVRGRQWTEDLNRFPSNRLRVEFDGPDISQEMLYTLFRPYGRLMEITPPAPVPAGNLRFAQLQFSRIEPSVAANNCLHGFSSPTKTADYDRKKIDSDADIKLARLRIFYESPLKAHYVRDWVTNHPRLSIPIIAFLIGTLSYTFFDPIRAFFVRSEVEGAWNIEDYSAVRFIRDNVYQPIMTNLFGTSSTSQRRKKKETLGRASWKDRVEAEKAVENWLSEFPSTFIVVTGPPGSGKHNLINRVVKHTKKQAIEIDCASIAKAKTDVAVIDGLAHETGYWPTFSFLQSINGLIDLAAVGLIGQKAGFATPVDEQLRSMLDVVTIALKDAQGHAEHQRQRARQCAEDDVVLKADREHQLRLIKAGVWHDGRLDCVAGNGIMSELGLGQEEPTLNDVDGSIVPLIDGNAPIDGEGVPPTTGLFDKQAAAAAQPPAQEDPEIDTEAELIATMPIVILRNFAIKPARGDLWNVLSEWGASLIENKVAHVIVIGEGSTTTKTLTRALPSKPLDLVALSDADRGNSLEYVREKLGNSGHLRDLDSEDEADIAKLGGRMVDLELLVYKVRSGQSVHEAVHDIVLRNIVELRKVGFGDDTEDAKHLQWTRPQAWKIVTELAKKPEISYPKLLQDFPFKGAEASLKALEEHDIIGIVYHDGRPSRIRPGKPVFVEAFSQLVKDDVFRAQCQIEYNTAIGTKAESEIKTIEDELNTLREISANGDKLGVGEGGWFGLTKGSPVYQRAQYLLAKLDTAMDKLNKADADTTEQKKVFSSGKA
ncbi:mitochondrial escape protein 2 [Vanrija albida]|uniref:Mitochondrial escape protein 2 n=1 Tax=Vanrija albida TaxID=181172 RepID=A0ABR3Q8E7_9TREE